MYNLFLIGKCFCLVPIDGPTASQLGSEDLLNLKAAGEEHVKAKQPLPWLFSTLSYQIQSAQIARTSRALTKVRGFNSHF